MSVDEHNEWKVPPARPCVACGEPHGSVGARINCLEASVVALRARLRELSAELARVSEGDFAKLRAEVTEVRRKWPWNPPGTPGTKTGGG